MTENYQTGLLGEAFQALNFRRYRLHRKELRALYPRNRKLFGLPHVNPNQPVCHQDSRLNLLRTEFQRYWDGQYSTFSKTTSKKAWEKYSKSVRRAILKLKKAHLNGAA
jgi:hypothetical protein